jgi:hypothetical protein
MYHVELRHFPFTAYRFNLGDRELLALLDPWVHDKWIDLDERKWSPQQARITVLEGPEMPVYELSMGRGWRSAERKSKDVTPEMLERARALLVQAPGGPGAAATRSDAAVPGATGQPVALPDEAPARAALTGSMAGPALGVTASPGSTQEVAASAAPRPPESAEHAPVGGAGAGAAGEPDLRSLLGDDPHGLLQAWQLVAQRRPELTPSESLALAEQTLRSLG